MTCVVGLRTDEGVWLGSDGRATTGDRIIDMIPEKLFAYRIYDLNDQIHPLRVGVAGNAAYYQQLRGAFLPPHDETSGDAWQYLFQFFDAAKLLLRDVDATAVIAYRGHLFHIDPDQTVLPIEKQTAIGTGGSYALGSLATTAALDWSPHRRVIAALSAAAECSSSCAPPFQVWEPNSFDFETGR